MVHVLRVFVFLNSCHFRRPNGETSVVTDDLQPGERLRNLFLDLFKDRPITEKVQGVSYGNIASIREMDFLWMFLELFLGPFESAVTGHAWDKKFPIALLCNSKISGSEVDRQFLIRAVGRTGTAAGPVFQFMELDIEEVRYASNRIVIFPSSPMEGASGIIGNFFHLLSPFSREQ
jgi:hypothetical protein